MLLLVAQEWLKVFMADAVHQPSITTGGRKQPSENRPRGEGTSGECPPVLFGQEVIMVVLCAWCEQEGGQALIHETQPHEPMAQSPSESHGICSRHEAVLRGQIQQLWKKEQIRHIPRRLSLPNARGDKSPIAVMYL